MPDLSLYRHILQTAEWQSVSLPANIAEWLLHTDSLTEKLLTICDQFSVQRTFEGWKTDLKAVKNTERNVESSDTPTAYWQREVLLKCGQNEWIFAQTNLPKKTIDNVAQEFLTLGNRAVGLWLFPQNPTRLSLEWSQDQTTGLYARRSCLLLKGYPLEINELFLPEFPF